MGGYPRSVNEFLQRYPHFKVDFCSLISPYPAGNKSDLLVFATSIESAQPVRPYSLTRLYTVGCPSSSFNHDIPKLITDSSKNGRWVIPFGLRKTSNVNCFLITNILLYRGSLMSVSKANS